jgi:hypothetical protein
MEAGFRRRRCAIFRAYLCSLRTEFLAALIEWEALRTGFPEDTQPLAPTVLLCRVLFAWAMIRAYLCWFRYRWKLGGPGLEPVVRRFDRVRAETQRWIPEIPEPRP